MEALYIITLAAGSITLTLIIAAGTMAGIFYIATKSDDIAKK